MIQIILWVYLMSSVNIVKKKNTAHVFFTSKMKYENKIKKLVLKLGNAALAASVFCLSTFSSRTACIACDRSNW